MGLPPSRRSRPTHSPDSRPRGRGSPSAADARCRHARTSRLKSAPPPQANCLGAAHIAAIPLLEDEVETNLPPAPGERVHRIPSRRWGPPSQAPYARPPRPRRLRRTRQARRRRQRRGDRRSGRPPGAPSPARRGQRSRRAHRRRPPGPPPPTSGRELAPPAGGPPGQQCSRQPPVARSPLTLRAARGAARGLLPGTCRAPPACPQARPTNGERRPRRSTGSVSRCPPPRPRPASRRGRSLSSLQTSQPRRRRRCRRCRATYRAAGRAGGANRRRTQAPPVSPRRGS